MNVTMLYFWFLTMLGGKGDFLRLLAGSLSGIVRGFCEGGVEREKSRATDSRLRLFGPGGSGWRSCEG